MKIRYRALLSTLFLSIAIYALQLLAVEHTLYFRWWWFDIFMHFLGGIIIGLFWMWFIGRLGVKHMFSLFLFVVLLVGVSWEYFEYFFNIAYAGDAYWKDTSIDLVMDAVGASFVYVLFKNKFTIQHE